MDRTYVRGNSLTTIVSLEMKYDDASWHYGGNFPEDLPEEAGATHIGMFVAWLLLVDLGSSTHCEDFPEELAELQSRKVTPAEFFLEVCDEKFTSDDLNAEGNAFAQSYYQPEDAPYLADYETILCNNLPSIYHVADTWENFDLLKPILDKRLQSWRRAK